MANVYQSGSIYVDSTGSLISKRCKVAYIIFTADSNNHNIILRDGTTSGAPLKLKVQSASGKSTTYLDFSKHPIVFNSGIYATIDSNATATLVLTSEGDIG